MSRHYELSETAEQDLHDLAAHVLQRFGELVAERTIARVEDACELLAINPKIGHERLELAPPPFRLWPVGPSVILYRPDTQPIQIARIVRGNRDLTRIFEEQEQREDDDG